MSVRSCSGKLLGLLGPHAHVPPMEVQWGCTVPSSLGHPGSSLPGKPVFSFWRHSLCWMPGFRATQKVEILSTVITPLPGFQVGPICEYARFFRVWRQQARASHTRLVRLQFPALPPLQWLVRPRARAQWQGHYSLLPAHTCAVGLGCWWHSSMGERNGKVSPRWASLESGSLWIHEKWPGGPDWGSAGLQGYQTQNNWGPE